MKKFPSFYDAAKANKRFRPDIARAIEEGQNAGLQAASKAKRKVALVIVDPQDSFVLADGELPVTGAFNDLHRLIENRIFGNAEELTSVIVSLDQHIPFQIFFSLWWEGRDGKHPKPFTPINAKDVQDGVWRPLLEKDWSTKYVEQLKQIFIWPPHCMIGTEGANVYPPLAEAIAWLAAARKIQPTYIFKGTVPKSEHYGIFAPCVPVPDHPQGGMNTTVLDAIATNDVIDFSGEAEDFCVHETMTQFLSYFSTQSDVLKRVRFLRDCTSLVFPDKRKDADNFLDSMAAKGMQIVKSTD